MLCLRCTRSLTGSLRSPIASRAVGNASQSTAKRTFTSITPLRPTLSSFRPSALSTATPTQTITEDLISTTTFNLIPDKLAISSHPAFAGLGSQVRCAPRDTFDPSHFVRKRRHGFLSRVKTRKGRNLLKRRKLKGRNTLSH